MPDRYNNKKQTNQYDKIIKENLEQTLPVIIKELLCLDVIESEEIPDDIQHTKEREPDALKKITDSKGNIYILHVEFQVQNENDMVYRMAEYSIMLMRRYKIPVKQFVIFLKEIKPTMTSKIETPNLKYNYELIRISKVSHKLFLKTKNPEVRMLGILADMGDDPPSVVIQSIIDEINATESNLTRNKYFKQLRIFVQLRTNVEHQFEKAMQSVTTFFKEENDIFYRKGEAKKSQAVVENLILELGFSDEQAARIAEVSVAYVAKVRQELNNK
ncbi:RpnC/YadD family protein [Pedobacter sp. PWIIR3]